VQIDAVYIDTEGDFELKSFDIRVTLSYAPYEDVALQYSTADDVATADSDYAAVVERMILIPAGSTTGNVTVQVNGDMEVELDETFTVSISNPVNATLGAQTACTVTITNDDIPPLTGIAAISSGDWHKIALKNDGTVWAWGGNHGGRLGDGTTENRSRPVQVVGLDGVGFLTGITAIACGHNHSIALKSDGTVWAWGRNNYSQLGDGTTTDSSAPIQVIGQGGSGFLTNITAISGGQYHTMALKDDWTLWAWGRNNCGQLGDGTMTNSPTPVQVVDAGGSGYLTDITAIAVGRYHNLALKSDGTVWTWGYNNHGQLGDGTTADSPTPIQVVGQGGSGFLTGITTIACGYYHTIAVKNDESAWAWGYNRYGQLGDETIENRSTPVQVLGPGGTGYFSGITAIACGHMYTIALRDDWTVWAWGENDKGQLGDGTLDNSATPVQVSGPGGFDFITDMTAIAGGYKHSTALKNDGIVWAWGYNEYGQLGNDTETDSSTPVRVVEP
jgi:alpha-tubulin suppressor-like RCC1 family protein